MKLVNHLVVAGLVILSTTAFAKPGKVETKIVGGVEASVGEFPFIVSLQGSYGHFCGGSLIKENWVLTAAHCVRGATVRNVVIGLHDQKNMAGAEIIAPKRTIVHPEYNSYSMENDFALIELSSNSSFQPVALNAAEITEPNVMTTTAGWGATRENSYTLPNLLQKVDVPLVSKEECNVGYNDDITDSMICAGYPEGGKDACQGDSGGPLVVKDTENQTFLVGVVSWGKGCARANYYGVYSKVSSAVEWVSQHVQ